MATTLMCDLLSLINDKKYKVEVNHQGQLTQLNLDECWAADIARVLATCSDSPTTADLQNIQDACKECKVAVLKNCDESWGVVAVPSVTAHQAGETLALIGAPVIGGVSSAEVTNVFASFLANQSGGVGSQIAPRGHLVHPNAAETGVVSLFVVKGDVVIGLHFPAPVDSTFVGVTEELECAQYEECPDDEDEEDDCEEECGFGNFRLLV